MTAATLSGIRSAFPPRTQLNFDPPFFLNLLAPAIVLAALMKFSSVIAAEYGIFFTAHAATILYAYFALARCVYIHNNSRNSEGRYDRPRAKKAEQDFHRTLKRLAGTVMQIAIPLVLVAIVMDCLTIGRQPALRDTADALIILAELAVWYAIGPNFIIACAKWTPVSPPSLPRARALIAAHRNYVRSSFVFMSILLGILCIGSLAVLYMPLRALVVSIIPSGRAVYLFSMAFHACLAGLALWVQCIWSVHLTTELAKLDQPEAHWALRPHSSTTISWPWYRRGKNLRRFLDRFHR
jgi:hypothetical protein